MHAWRAGLGSRVYKYSAADHARLIVKRGDIHMKSHLMQAPIFRMSVRALAAIALIASGVLLTFVPARIASAATVSLQCQVNPGAGAHLIHCSGPLPSGTVTLSCQSPSPITSN